MNEISKGIYRTNKDILTINLVPGFKSYAEKSIRIGKGEYRIWDPKKSKLSAAITKGLKEIPLYKGSKVLYLGIASGTSASHISDVIGETGIIYGIEFAPRSIRDLTYVAEKRKNIIPILSDARIPVDYASIVEQVDFIFEDIAQKDQVEIFTRNAKIFLKKGGYGMIAIKSRSIDVSKNPEIIFKESRKKLETDFNVIQQVNLNPFEKDHMLFFVKMK
ncbi:MAG: fibrillarin-like rRNA/tRNA 2'-O-methyltransferase [DPANN group archaeon]|nr:fibrillarin-like rRNA/tRNA 2'-O-methyltransferase [DPANN group archaeon]